MESPSNVIPFPNIIKEFDKLSIYLKNKIATLEANPDSDVVNYEVNSVIVLKNKDMHVAVSMKLENGELTAIDRPNIEYIIDVLNKDSNVNRHFYFNIVRVIVDPIFSDSTNNNDLFKVEITKK